MSLEYIQKTRAQLPSKGLPYPPGVEIFVRPYTVGELRRLSGDLGREAMLRIILEGISVEGGEDSKRVIAEITMGDLGYLATLRKLLTLGDGDPVTAKLEVEGKIYSAALVLSELPFKELEVEACPVTVENIGGRESVVFHPLTVGRYFKTLRYTGDRPKELVALGTMILSAEELRDVSKIEQAADFISGLTGESATLLNMVATCYEHGMDVIELKSEAGESLKYRVEWDSDGLQFFRPEGKSEDALRKRLRFGAASNLPK